MQKDFAIDEFARIELGFRIKSTEASYQELEPILGKEAQVKWADTLAHKGGATYFAIPTELDQDDRVWVPENVIDAFTRYGGHLMVKLVTPLPKGHYANLAFYDSKTGQGKLWGFDKTQAQRANGDYVYSLPIHGLDKAGEGRRFFFVLRLDQGPDNMIVLTVDRIDVTRGKEHFTIGPARKFGPFPPTNPQHVAAIARRWEVQQGKETYKPLKDLPLEAAVQEYLKRFN